MKKLFFFTPIIFLIFATTLTKNSTKKLDKEIFQLKENIRILDDRYELTLLDYSILTSPKKLMEYQQFYFDDKFKQKKIENLNKIEFLKGKLKTEKIIQTTSIIEAVAYGYRFAKKGETVLLSPACASFDLFENYEERGNEFKKAVRSL